MDEVIDLSTWPRCAAFEHFRAMAQPAFSVCVTLDVSGLKARARASGASLWLAYHHAALAALNDTPALRLSWDGHTLRRLATLHGSFGIVSLPWVPGLAEFAAVATPRVERVRSAAGSLFAGDEPCAPEHALVHMTALPWLAFTAFQHARGQGDWQPKVAFGKIENERLPVAVDVHHALVDGVDVGRFVERLQLNLRG
jgi:chloramphenicol O-acetyltransferase type A